MTYVVIFLTLALAIMIFTYYRQKGTIEDLRSDLENCMGDLQTYIDKTTDTDDPNRI